MDSHFVAEGSEAFVLFFRRMSVPVIRRHVQVVEATIRVMDVPRELAYWGMNADDSHPVPLPGFIALWMQRHVGWPDLGNG